MANANYSDMLATTIENRSRKVADNVTNNNAILKRLSQRGNIKTFSGGHKILQELTYAENRNTGWYSGYDLLPVGVSDVVTAAEYEIKQAAVPVVMSGLEMLKNSSREQMIDLMETRLKVAEASLTNLLVNGIYSDGTTPTTKQITGLQAMLPLDGGTSTSYGGIAGGTYSFWQCYADDDGDLNSLETAWNTMWANLVRGQDRPDLIMVDTTAWEKYLSILQTDQRFTNTNSGDLGFTSLKFMDADVVLDGGMYGSHAATDIPAEDYTSNQTGTAGMPTATAYFLNTNYIHWRPHSRRNIVPLSPNRRYATNQDAEVQIMAWAGNLTCSGRKFQGVYNGS